tara:strand:- start:48 stop:1028 length:981 start_codon:yes stop_codon:yes gene_type:complete
MSDSKHSHIAAAGLPSTHADVAAALQETGIDSERLSVIQLGHRSHLSGIPAWAWRLMLGLGLWSVAYVLNPILSERYIFLEAASQLIVGLTLNAEPEFESSFSVVDLLFISLILLSIFVVYIYKLLTSYAEEESEVRENLAMSEADIAQRLELVYANVKPSSFVTIAALFLIGVAGALFGGHEISGFAATMIQDLNINPILTALVLALFAGMSEYVILWQSHRKREYGIALANAFGGITQVMFLVLPFTLLSIAVYQGYMNPSHPELPLDFSISNTFLLLFLFPTFYTLSSLLEEDHTLGILDTTIMTGIFLFLIVLLVRYGGALS